MTSQTPDVIPMAHNEGRVKTGLANSRPTGIAMMITMVILAAAIVFHAFANRYEFANLNVRQFTRRDRLTGRVEVCSTRGRDLPAECVRAVAR